MAIAQLEPRIEDVANYLVDRVIKNGQMDLIRDLAYPLPVTVIAELLGVPVEDRNIFQVWADKLVSSGGKDPSEQSESTKTLITIQSEMDEYFGPICEQYTCSIIVSRHSGTCFTTTHDTSYIEWNWLHRCRKPKKGAEGIEGEGIALRSDFPMFYEVKYYTH